MILETIKTTFILTISMIGVFVLFGMIYNFIEKKNSAYIQQAFGFNGILITGVIGTTIHELSHFLMALIFGHKIVEIELFRPRAAKIDGVLGFVEHRYNKRSLYQRIGNFFIGIAPMIFGTIAISISFRLLLPEMFLKLNISEYIDLINTNNLQDIYILLANNFKILFDMVFSISNLINFRFWIFLFIMYSISTHMSLSKADLKNSGSGLICIFVTTMFVSVICTLLKIELSVLQSVFLKYNLYLTCFLALGLIFGLISLGISFLFYRFK